MTRKAKRHVEPARLTVTRRRFSRGRRGDSAEAGARAALATLVAGGTTDDSASSRAADSDASL